MKALVLAKAGEIAIEDVQLAETLGPDDVQIKIHSVGICGSDVHYYQHGRIGPFVVNAPMVLGHEASGVVLATGKNVTHLSIGDRVCMEPGIPDLNSAQTRAGIYNLDPAVRFWATPPVHGCLRETVIHPAAFTFKLPDNVSFAEGAMVEPLAIGMQAATKAGIKPGDIALVIGAGPIGVVTALAALAGGCSDVIICDLFDEKLAVAASYEGLHAVNIKTGKWPRSPAAMAPMSCLNAAAQNRPSLRWPNMRRQERPPCWSACRSMPRRWISSPRRPRKSPSRPFSATPTCTRARCDC